MSPDDRLEAFKKAKQLWVDFVRQVKYCALNDLAISARTDEDVDLFFTAADFNLSYLTGLHEPEPEEYR